MAKTGYWATLRAAVVTVINGTPFSSLGYAAYVAREHWVGQEKWRGSGDQVVKFILQLRRGENRRR